MGSKEVPKKKKKEAPPGVSSEGMSDEERMREYAHTGDPAYLTFELANRMNVSPDVLYQVENADEIEERAFDTAEAFEKLKFDERIGNIWETKYSTDPPSFFSTEAQEELRTIPPEERLVLLARASLHITVTPSMAEQHFQAFPEDKKAATHLILMTDGLAEDGITHTFFTLIWRLVDDEVDVDLLAGTRRSGGQRDEIYHRREYAPEFLLSNHEEGGTQFVKKFGDAAQEYERAAKEAHQLAMVGDVPLDTGRIFTNKDYQKLLESQKAEMLRMALDDMQFALVFDETFNSHFTPDRIERDNEWLAQNNRLGYTPAHSMLYQTRQGAAAYELPDEFFQREMDSTAMIGGAVEEYPHHRILLETLRAFPRVSADQEKNTELLVEFWLKNRNPIFRHSLAEALRAQDQQHAEELLRVALEKDTWDPLSIAVVLYDVALTEELQGEERRELFKQYAEIARKAADAQRQLDEFFGDSVADEDAKQRFKELLFEHNRELLIRAYESLKQGQDLSTLLDEAQTATSVFVRAFRAMHESGNLRWDVIKDTSLEHVPSMLLDENDIQRMETMLKQNYDRIEHYTPEFRETVLEGTREAFGYDRTHWYILRHQDQIIGFNRFDELAPTEDGRPHRYFGSFNVDRSFGNGKLGEALMEQSFLHEARDGAVIEADCDPKAPITQKYIEAGFVAEDIYDLEGVPSFHIRLDEQLNEKLVMTSWSEDEIIESADAALATTDARIEVSEEVPDFSLLNAGYLLTRYFRRDGRYYAVFEKPRV